MTPTWAPTLSPARNKIANLLQEEASLMEIVKLSGADVLPEDQKLVIETAKLIRVGFLQQNSYNPIDTYVPLDKQLKMMQVILRLYDGAKALIARSIPLSQLKATGIFETLAKIKYEVTTTRWRSSPTMRSRWTRPWTRWTKPTAETRFLR